MLVEQGDYLTKNDIYDVGKVMVENMLPIDGIAYYLYTLSKTYVDVSQRYVVDHLADLKSMASKPESEQARLRDSIQ